MYSGSNGQVALAPLRLFPASSPSSIEGIDVNVFLRMKVCLPLSITTSTKLYDGNSFNVTMNILEDQVTDLNYLAESPISLPGIVMDGGRNSSSAESPPKQDEGGSKNRKIDEPSNNNGSLNLSHTRAKRNRYISIAWYVRE